MMEMDRESEQQRELYREPCQEQSQRLVILQSLSSSHTPTRFKTCSETKVLALAVFRPAAYALEGSKQYV